MQPLRMSSFCNRKPSFIYLFSVTSFFYLLLFLFQAPFAALLCSKFQGIIFVTLHCLRASGLALPVGCCGGGLERGGGEKSWYFSTYRDCTPLRLWFLLDCPMTHSAAPHQESSLEGSSSWALSSLSYNCRTQGEGTKEGPHIHVQYLKVISQTQTVQVFSIFLFRQKYLHDDKLKGKKSLVWKSTGYLSTHIFLLSSSHFPNPRLICSSTYQSFLFPLSRTVRIL